MDRQTADDDGRQVITIAHSEPCSGELKLTKATNKLKVG